jgi:hypothetical protein
MILVAASKLPKTFTMEQLIVTAWKEYPKSFALRGYPEHPDSNRVQSKVYGRESLLGLGLLKRVDLNSYALTNLGKQTLKKINGEDLIDEEDSSPVPVVEEPVFVPPPVVVQPAKIPEIKAYVLKTVEPVKPPEPTYPALALSEREVLRLHKLTRKSAVMKYRSAGVVTFQDAKDFWDVSHPQARNVQQELDAMSNLLNTAINCYNESDGNGHPSLPKRTVINSMLNLHAFLRTKFANELSTMG